LGFKTRQIGATSETCFSAAGLEIIRHSWWLAGHFGLRFANQGTTQPKRDSILPHAVAMAESHRKYHVGITHIWAWHWR